MLQISSPLISEEIEPLIMLGKPPIFGSEKEQILQGIFAEVFQRVAKRQIALEISVSFYPFAGLNHTIRLRNQKLHVRVSDIIQEAPLPVFFALAQILVGKLLKRRPNEEAETLYQQYIYQPEIMQASERARQLRGRKFLRGAHGKHYDLERIFTKLNYDYFDNQLPLPKLSWSQRPNKRILGHHDAVHKAIVISCSLDRRNVPDYVVEYVVYHEMLHIKHPTLVVNGKRRYHTSAFRAEEKQFMDYTAAVNWLEQATHKR